MRWGVLVGLVLILTGIVGLVASDSEAGPAFWRGPGAAEGLGAWGWMGWGHMPGHMGGGMPGHMPGWTQGGPAGNAPAAVASAPTLEVSALDFGFRPAQVRIRAGQTVNIALANRGAVLHDLTIPGLRFHLVAQAAQRVAGSLTATRPGTYEVYCSVPGHREAGMIARLVVTP